MTNPIVRITSTATYVVAARFVFFFIVQVQLLRLRNCENFGTTEILKSCYVEYQKFSNFRNSVTSESRNISRIRKPEYQQDQKAGISAGSETIEENIVLRRGGKDRHLADASQPFAIIFFGWARLLPTKALKIQKSLLLAVRYPQGFRWPSKLKDECPLAGWGVVL